MLAFLAAVATLAAAPAPEAEAQVLAAPPLLRDRSCGMWEAKPVRRLAPQGRFQSLGELPPANFEFTLLRVDKDGCSVPVGLRRNVEGDGHFPQPRR